MVALPLTGVAGARLLPAAITGNPPAPYRDTADAVGEGVYLASSERLEYSRNWRATPIAAEVLGTETGAEYFATGEAGASAELRFNGQSLEIAYSMGPDHGIWAIEIDDQPLRDTDGEPITIDAYHPTNRYEVTRVIKAEVAGEHTLRLVNTGQKNPQSQGTLISLGGVEVLPPIRASNLGMIIGIIAIVEAIGLLFAWLLGPSVFSRLATLFDTKRSIYLALTIYAVIAIWGFFLNSVIEFWFLAWMVAVVQGGSQALSRSLFSSMVPAAKSGEFFGLFGVMEKFSAMIGPLIFAYVAATFSSSRPAVLSIVAFFLIGGLLLTRVNVAAGQQVAQAEDAALLRST